MARRPAADRKRAERPPLPVGLMALCAIVGVVTATVVIGAVMQIVTLPHLLELGGARPFDTRVLGYDRAAAVAFLKALGPVGRSEYLRVQLSLDTIFPPLYAVCFGLGLAEILGRAGLGRRAAFVVAFAVILPTAVADLAENAAIAEMLRRPPDAVGADLVAVASFRTTLKWACAAAGLLVAAGAGAIVLRRRSRENGSP